MANSKRDGIGNQMARGLSLLDRGLYVGPVVAVIGLLAGDPGLIGAAAAYWVFSYAYCAPWLAYIARRKVPAQDHALVAAVLAWASAPWGLFIPYGDDLVRPHTIGWAVLAAMAPGVAALIATRFPWAPRSALWRSVVLVSGGVIYLGWIAAYVWLAGKALAPADTLPAFGVDMRPFFVAAIALLPAAFIALRMAVRLVVAPFDVEQPTAAD